jgi:HlyD family secretion protein
MGIDRVETRERDEDKDILLGRETKRLLGRRAWWIALAVIALLAIYTVSRFFFGGPAQPTYRTAEIARGNLTVSISAIGNIVPNNQIAVGSQISGLVTQVLVETNDRVERGQPLAMLDTRRLQDAIRVTEANIAQGIASVSQQRSTLAEARAQLARLEEVFRLSGGKSPSAAELSAQRASVQRSEASLQIAQAQVKASRAQLSSDRTQIGYAVIRSPVSGMILTRQVEPGQTVAAAFSSPTLFTVAENLTRMKLDISVDEADVGRLRPGQSASFAVDAFPQRRFRAIVRKVNYAASNLSTSANTVVSYVATLDIENADLSLRPGMTAAVDVRVQDVVNALLVPNAALRYLPNEPSALRGDIKISLNPGAREPKVRGIGTGSRQIVYVVDALGRASPVPVQIGPTNGAMTVITDGKVGPGTRVVTSQMLSATP